MTDPSSRSPRIIPNSNRTLNFPRPCRHNAINKYSDPMIVKPEMIVWPVPLMNSRRGLVEVATMLGGNGELDMLTESTQKPRSMPKLRVEP